MVAPNGARLTPRDHPALPVTLDRILADAAACHAAGADGLHLHLRDADGGHLLDAGAYREALTALRGAVPALRVQITTEAAGRYDPAHQRRVALDGGACAVSVSVREVTADGTDGIAAFYHECAARGIAVQHILYDRADADALSALLPVMPATQVLFVLGRHAPGQRADPADLTPFLDWMAGADAVPDWAACAFGRAETACLVRAHAHGGKLRVGFENARHHADGTVARSNADRVAAVRAAAGI